MTYTRKAVRGASMIFIMSMLASVLAYVMRVVLARHLGAAEFGLFYAVFTFVIFFMFFRDLGFPQAIIKYIAEFKVKERNDLIKSVIASAFYIQIACSCLFALIFYFLAPYLAVNYFKNPEAATILRIFIFYIFGSVLFIISKDILLGFQKTALFSLGEFFKNGLVLALVVLFFYLGKGVYAPVYAFAIVCFLLFIIYFPLVLREFPLFRYRSGEFPAVAKKMVWFAFPVFATAVGSKIIGYVDTLMLTYFRSLPEVGVYNAVLPTSSLLLYFGSCIGSVTLPMASEFWARGDHRRLMAGIEIMYKYLFILILPVCAVLFVFTPFILQNFFGPEYVVGVTAMRILLLGSLIFTLADINYNIFTAIGKPQTVTTIVFLSAAVNAGLNLILIPKWGITGAGISTATSYLFAFIFSIWKMKSYLNVKAHWKRWSALLFVGAILVYSLFKIPSLLSLNPWLEIGIAIVCSLLIYLFLLYCFNIIDLQEIARYYRLVRGKETNRQKV